MSFLVHILFSDKTLGCIGMSCLLLIVLIVLEYWLDEREMQRDQRATASMRDSGRLRPAGNWIVRARRNIPRRQLVMLAIILVAFTTLLKGHGGSQTPAAAIAAVPASSKALSDKAGPGFLDTNVIVLHSYPLTWHVRGSSIFGH